MPKEIYPVLLTKIEAFSPSVRNFHFEFRKKPRFDFKAGQFVQVELVKEGKNLKKSYSIASPPHFKDRIELCIKLVEGGFASNWFFNLKEGDEIEVQGPMGVFAIKAPLPKELIFVGTGTGIAPLRAQALDLIEQGATIPMTMISGVRHEEDILFREEMEKLEKERPGFRFIPTLSRPAEGWTGARGYVQQILKEHFASAQGREVYLCGLVPMVNETKEILTQLGYAKEAIHFEKWT